ASPPAAVHSVSVADLLKRPRAELATQAEELLQTVHTQEKARRGGQMPFALLPQLRLPLHVPVLRQAKFSATAGVSLPPYCAAGGKDLALALHLARHGDVEAALKLIDTKDAASRTRIEAFRLERNYPVEWSRLVGLHLHQAQFRLAAGEADGGRQVAELHKQLQTVLDARARAGALGATLLPRGHTVLTQAAKAWRDQNRADLAKELEAALASWGQVPLPLI